MQSKQRFAILGAFLGFCAPLGAILLRTLTSSGMGLSDAASLEWQQAGFCYTYMTVGAIVTFGVFGYLLGKNRESLTDLAITDGLTKAYSRHHLHEKLAYEMKRSIRYQTPLTCVMIDVDDFKKTNEWLGRPFGDMVLRTIARLMLETVRQTDIVGRYGGEEFLIIMPNAGEEAALTAVERMFAAIRSYPFVVNEKPIPISVSMGLATHPGGKSGLPNKDELLSAADKALRQAKRAGKDQSSIWRGTW